MKDFILNLYKSKLGKTAVWAGIFVGIKVFFGFDFVIIAFISAFAANNLGVPIEFPSSPEPPLMAKPTHTNPYRGTITR